MTWVVILGALYCTGLPVLVVLAAPGIAYSPRAVAATILAAEALGAILVVWAQQSLRSR